MKKTETTVKTRKKLMDSFWQLYCEKGMEKVTVGFVTKLAGLNRGTFYEYFTDIYDLLNQLEDDLLTELQAEIEESFSDGIPLDFQEFSRTCAHIFSRHDNKIYILLSERGDLNFVTKLKNRMQPVPRSIFRFSEQEIQSEYLTAFAFSAMVGMINFWYANGKNMSIDELFQLAQALVANGVLGYTNRKIFE